MESVWWGIIVVGGLTVIGWIITAFRNNRCHGRAAGVLEQKVDNLADDIGNFRKDVKDGFKELKTDMRNVNSRVDKIMSGRGSK